MQCILIKLNNPIGMAVNGPHQMHNKCKVIICTEQEAMSATRVKTTRFIQLGQSKI